VKTAISIPDAAYERVKRHAERLGMSRSEFFTKAAERWADELEQPSVTDAVNAVVDAGYASDGQDFTRAAARELFATVDDDPATSR
jgi:hypothetical protein